MENSVQSAMVLQQDFDIIEHIPNRELQMRRKLNRQTNLFTAVSSNPIARELEEISKIIDANSGVLDLVYQDLVKAKRHDTGREGLTAEQVLRCCILKQYRQLSYEELAFHLEDSSAFRTFSRLEMGQYPCKSILQENIAFSLTVFSFFVPLLSMAMLLLWLGLYQPATGSGQCDYSLFTFGARPRCNIARFENVPSVSLR